MNRYTIYCSEQQTERALKLGAPIEEFCGLRPTTSIDGIIYDIPTEEQMVGWLEEQMNVREICIQRYGNWGYQIFIDSYCHLEKNGFASRKEAALAAIDAALDYLSNQKK